MLEAMAMSKPVLMTRSGCLHIDPASRKFGMLIEPHDAQNWACEMNRIVDNPDLANNLGTRGRKNC